MSIMNKKLHENKLYNYEWMETSSQSHSSNLYINNRRHFAIEFNKFHAVPAHSSISIEIRKTNRGEGIS